MSQHDPHELLENSYLVYSQQQVRDAVKQMAEDINRSYEHQALTLVAVMTGGMMPAVWLAEELSMPLYTDYVHATRYQGGTRGFELDYRVSPRLDMQGQHVLVLDDIYDEGYTLQAVIKDCKARGAASVRSAVLVRKDHDRGLDRDMPDFIGLDVPDVYVFGCGMDAYEHWRHLTEIRALRTD